MRNVIVLFWIALMTVGNLYAQQIVRFTSDAFLPSRLNPAAAGYQKGYQFDLLTRQQFGRVDVSDQLNSLSIHRAVLHSSMGLGGVFNSWNINGFKFQSFNAVSNYRVRLAKGTLGLGVSLGVKSFSIDFSKSNPTDLDDLALSQSGELTADFGAGLFFKHDKIEVGFSLAQLLPQLTLGTSVISSAQSSGYVRHLILKKSKLQLSQIAQLRYVKQQHVNGDYGLLGNYNDLLDLGVGYNTSKTIAISVMLHIDKVLKQINLPIIIGLATDMDVSSYGRGNRTEFRISYELIKRPSADAIRSNKKIESPKDFE